jgi:hypothetical protein
VEAIMTDGVVPVVPPPPYKNRRGWLVAFGVFEILIGCVLLALIAISMYGLRRVPENPAAPVSVAATMAMVAVMYGAMAVLFVSVGIGSIQAKRWARITMLVVGWCWLAIGVMTTAMMALMLPMIMENAKQQAKSPMPAGFDTGFRVGMLVVLGAFFVVLPLIFVLFYSGKNVKATVNAASNMGATELRKPVSVIVVAAWFALAAVSCIGLVFMPMGFPLFGMVLTGMAARAYVLVMVVVSAWLAWNLYHQRALAWRVAIGWLVIGLASMFVTQSRLGVVEMYRRMGYSELEIGRMMPLVTYGLYGGVIFGVAFLVFLIAIRRQFNDPSAVPATN